MKPTATPARPRRPEPRRGLEPRAPEGPVPEADPDRSRHIADFIAGMTDRYAISRYRELVGPIDLPEGF